MSKLIQLSLNPHGKEQRPTPHGDNSPVPTKSRPEELAAIFEKEFNPDKGRFKNNKLRKRAYNAIGPKLFAGDAFGAFYDAMRSTLTYTEWDEVIRHFSAAISEKVARETRPQVTDFQARRVCRRRWLPKFKS